MPSISRRAALEPDLTSFRDDPGSESPSLHGAATDFFSPAGPQSGRGRGRIRFRLGVGGLCRPELPQKPQQTIIAAVNGIACGGGFEIVLGTDIIVMENTRSSPLPEINVGVLADAGTVKLRRRIPITSRWNSCSTGRWMDAAEAKHWVWPTMSCPKGEGMTKAGKSPATDGRAGPAVSRDQAFAAHTEMVPEHEAFELHDR